MQDEAGRALDRAEAELNEARRFLTWVADNPGSEQAGISAQVVIPKASLINGGLAVQREMSLALMAEVDLAALAETAVRNLEEKVRDRMADALAAQNERRAAVGLPPLVVAGDEPEPRRSITADEIGTVTPPPGTEVIPNGPPYRGRRTRTQGAEA